jgi:chromosome segregation ATPase
VDDDDADEDDTVDSASRKQSVVHDAPLPVNGSHQNPKDAPPTTINDTQSEPLLPAADGPSSETLDAMARERDSLRVELADLRNKLESMQEKHRQDTEVLKSKAKNESSAQDKHLLESLQFVQEKHKQEIDLIKTEAHDAQATKDVAEMDELRTSINSMQEQHLSEIQHLEEQAQQAQAAKDSESLQVQELRQSLASVQQKHAEDVEALKKQAGEARTEEDNSEIKQLRQLIETMRDQHKKELDDVKSQAEHDEAAKGDSGSAELDQLRSKLQETQSGKENAESAYRTLLGKVNTIKSQLGERLKADAEELSKARAEIEELLEERQNARESQQDLQATIEQLQHQQTEYESELELLRSRTNLSQSNWIKERDELVSREAYAREEFENARQAMQDWEVLAMEERSLRESLSERVLEIEDQLNSQREAYERAASERDIQSSTVDSLQRALQDIQDARKKELRELVENSQSQLDALRAQADEAKASAAAATMSLEKAQKDLERALPFEKEVKEKNLLIGKLRHEAVILNDHLTKALRFLKRGKPEDNVDRHIVTNHFLHFLTLDRSDPKKFQVLQLIAALLGWTEGSLTRSCPLLL